MGAIEVADGTEAILRDLTIERGTLGAISNLGRLRLLRSVVQNSRIWEANGRGGGIFTSGRLVLVGSIVRRNEVGAATSNVRATAAASTALPVA